MNCKFFTVTSAILLLCAIWSCARPDAAGKIGDRPTTTAELTESIKSIYPRENDVFAMTSSGIYRGDVASRNWHRTDLANGMRLSGVCIGARGVDDVYYLDLPPTVETLGKLWRFEPNSFSWKWVYEAEGLEQAMVGTRGTLYVLTSKRSAGRLVQRILMSLNHGHTWSDITGGISSPQEMFRDRDDNDRIELFEKNNGPTVETRAMDYRYHWLPPQIGMTFGHPDDLAQDRPVRNYWVSNGVSDSFEVPATLANYFYHERESWFWWLGIDALTERPTYRFQRDTPMVVALSVTFAANSGSCTLVDDEDARRCWRPEVLEPDHERRRAAPAPEPAPIHKRRVTIDHDHPYRREIDLKQFNRFHQSGTYRVRLVYNGTEIGQGEPGAWCGGFPGECFTVTVQ